MLKTVKQRTTLHRLLSRYHFFITLLAVTLAWCTILFAGMTALRSYASQNLQLAAQLASYGAEPGLIFHDAEAAREGVQPLVGKDGIARLRVTTVNGAPLFDIASDTPDPSPLMTRLFMPDAGMAVIYHNGTQMGHVQVWGDSGALTSFVRLAMLAGLGCLIITIFGTIALKRRLESDLITPLSAIANVAHEVRLHRRFDKRVQNVGVAELDRLGSDVNALLEELQGWQGNIENERAILTHRATHDPLTTLPNRAAFDEQLNQRIAAARQQDTRFALVFIDADNFKQTNDNYGHVVGDQVLITLAKRISGALRQHDFAARLGGDEFVVILDLLHDRTEATEFAERLRQSVRHPITLAGNPDNHLSISVGIAEFPQHGPTAAELLTAADAAMYADKLRGRGTKSYRNIRKLE